MTLTEMRAHVTASYRWRKVNGGKEQWRADKDAVAQLVADERAWAISDSARSVPTERGAHLSQLSSDIPARARVKQNCGDAA